MPLSMEVKQLVKKSGYSILAWALNVFIAQGQYNLVAMIVVALCLAPRKTELDNNGVLSVLRNFKLRQNKKQSELMYAIRDCAEGSKHFDKIGATLVATWWWEYSNFHPRHTDPRLGTDDSMMFFTSARDYNNVTYQDELCDHCGPCQHERYFRHYRLILEKEGDWNVRVIGKQMDRWNSTMNKSSVLPNGYFEYHIPAQTVLHRIGDDLDGRTLADVMEPGKWYNYHFQPDTALDLVDHEAEAQLAQTHQQIANLVMQFGQLNG